MDSKEQIVKFYEMLLTVALIAIAIFYFVLGNRIYIFTFILKELTPIFMILAVFLLRQNIVRYQRRQLPPEKRRGFSLDLEFYHKLLTDFLMFLLPIAILLTAVIMNGKIETEDIVQASLSFIIFYFWQQQIFKGSNN